MSNEAKKRGLGRGLAALLANTVEGEEGRQAAVPGEGAEAAQTAAGSREQGTQQLALEALSPNPHQPRSQFDAASLEELADSIRAHGVIQPLLVTPAPEGAGHYWIIAGERRWRAARLAALTTVPVIVRAATAQALTELALVENIQRDDLNALEEALAYQALISDYGLTQAEVAARVGKSRSAVANAVRLLSLPQPAQAAVAAGRISAGHARALLALSEEEAVLAALREVERRQLSVRQTEALVKQWLEAAAQPQPGAQPQPDLRLLAHLGHLENRFRSVLGTKVNLSRNDDGSGRLVVHFYNDDDLAALYQQIAGEDE